MTNDEEEQAAATIEVNRDIPCEIYGVRYSRLAGSPTSRCYVTLTFDAVSYNRLSALLGANLKGQVTIHVVDIQAPLPDEEEGEEREPEGRQFILRANNGEAILPHAFSASTEDELKCTYCQMGDSHEIHLEVSAAAQALIDEARRAPADEAEAAEQADAEAALTGRSRQR